MPSIKTVTAKKTSAPAALQPMSSIVLNLTSFSPIASGVFCKLGNSVIPNIIAPLTIITNGGNSIDYQSGNPHGIAIKKLNAPLSFGINPLTGGQGPYVFAGLSLVPLTGKATDKNFSGAVWTASQLKFIALGADNGANWKLYLSVLDYSSGSPVLGIIDPDVENDVTALGK